MEYRDYYKTLGVPKTASATEIQKAYRGLARKFHPDVNKDENAETRFKEIGEAYEVLKDEEKRRHYDRFGSAWKQGQKTGASPPGFEDFDFGQGRGFSGGFGFGGDQDFGGSGFSNFFDALFGGGRGGTWQVRQPGGQGAAQRPAQGRDRETAIALPLEDLARGGRRKIELVDPETRKVKTLEVNLPKGIRPGQKIRLSGQGEPGRGGRHGDLFLVVELLPHSHFRLDGQDLFVDVLVTPWAAALGDEVKIPTLEGSATVKLPAGSSSGRQIRLRGKGMPGKSTSGDLFGVVKIVVPEELSEREKELFEELAKDSEFEP